MAEEEKGTNENYTHRYVGNHPQEFVVGETTVMVEPGGFVTPDTEDPVVQEMVETGVLLDMKGGETE
jgi:hypothetical protein